MCVCVLILTHRVFRGVLDAPGGSNNPLSCYYQPGAVVGNSMFCFGGTSSNNNNENSSIFIQIDVGSEPGDPLSVAALQKGAFYTDGSVLAVKLPPAVLYFVPFQHPYIS